MCLFVCNSLELKYIIQKLFHNENINVFDHVIFPMFRERERQRGFFGKYLCQI